MPPKNTPPVNPEISATGATPAAPDAWHHRALTLVLKLVAFGFAGTVGFIVDMLATLTMTNFGLHYLPARAIGIVVALFATYVINRGVTFRADASVGPSAVAAEGVRYAMVAVGTSLLNWAVYAAVLTNVPATPLWLAIAIGSAVAMVASYIGYARFAFRG